MASNVFLEKQYFPCYYVFLVAGVTLYKTKNAIINILTKIYRCWAVLFVVALIPMDTISFLLADPEKVSRPQLAIGLLFHYPTVFRGIFFYINRKEYETLMSYLQYETLITEDKEVLEIFEKEKDTTRRFNKIYAITITCGVLSFTAPPVAIGLYNMFGNDSDTILTMELPFPVLLPYDMDTAIGYTIGAAQMFFQVHLISFVFIGMDVLIAGLMRTTIAHLKCLSKLFSIVKAKREVEGQNNGKSEDELLEAVKYLQRIHKGHNVVENLQHLMLFAQYLGSITILALGLYRNTKDFEVDIALLKSCGFFVIVLFEPFLYCYLGDLVTREAEHAKMALYDSDWVGSRIDHQRTILLTLTRLGRPLLFTCGRLMPLSNATFLTIVNTAYSAFNLLKQSN